MRNLLGYGDDVMELNSFSIRIFFSFKRDLISRIIQHFTKKNIWSLALNLYKIHIYKEKVCVWYVLIIILIFGYNEWVEINLIRTDIW